MEDGDVKTIIGIAVQYNVDHPSSFLGITMDRFLPGCFRQFIADREVALCRMHDHGTRYASTRCFPREFELFDSPNFLAFRYIVPNDDTQGTELWREVHAGALPEASIGFCPVRDDVVEYRSGRLIRQITEADLGEVSVVTQGAVPGTRSLALGAGAARLNVSSAMRTGSLMTAAILADMGARFDQIADLAERLDDHAFARGASPDAITFSATGRILHVV